MILFWSGTGNSAHVARVLGQALGDELVDLGQRMRHTHAPLVSQKPWILSTPIYGWRIPRVVTDYLASCGMQGSRVLVVVATHGSSSGNAQGFARRFFRRLGIELVGFADVRMPENYLALFKTPSDEEARALNKWAERKIGRIATMLAEGKRLPPQRVGLWGHFLSWAVNPVFYRFLVKDGKFYATSRCDACALCVRLCPLANISLSAERGVLWHGKCTHCMACIAHCPRKAIEYGSATKGRNRYLYRGF